MLFPAKFLFSLGLRRYPSLPELLQLAASLDEALRTVAYKYFLDNLGTRYTDYSPADYANIAFVPALTADGKAICSPPLKVRFLKDIYSGVFPSNLLGILRAGVYNTWL